MVDTRDINDPSRQHLARPAPVKTQEDLAIAVRRMQQQYEKGRIDRDILRGWVLGLSSYPPPHGAAVDALKAWFGLRTVEITPDVRERDITLLAAVADLPVATRRSGP
ncbi:hypothetical protein ASG25_07705 [Rhizobium sp. Leaf384]|jgi:hypothetical protein|uniref:hypothetical protein n=1 Tax=unclassified Rhizobium TaxID=2613769 RepID=UPI0007155E24|nr:MULTISPECIES: hypothetical protein [unclassified Rhizobium]KQR78126.1 hypothetical protein ASG03_17570 [Rhizobium sp. Leaf341]KQS81339.1 hypothetical protein ASG25_07705 [Rhizobium sp. Leaf384]KQS87248.1 hypothetical protein ASG58_03265 [Rhizobium sp. Leaf383]